MAKYLKPQTPLQHQSGDYIYPITTIDQVLMDNGERLNANIINIQLDGAPEDNINFGINADTLGGQKPEYYATAEDLVALNDSKLSMELLWENASPTSAFSAQTITLDLSEYDGAFICTNWGDGLAMIGSPYHCHLYDYGSNWQNLYKRTFWVSETNVGVTECAKLSLNNVGAGTQIDNGLGIPLKIYGIKGVSA